MAILQDIILITILVLSLLVLTHITVVITWEVFSDSLYDYRYAKSRPTEQTISLKTAVRKNIKRENKFWDEVSIAITTEEMTKQWLKLRFMKIEDKILAAKAGLTPENARKAFRKLGKDAISTQAHLLSAQSYR